MISDVRAFYCINNLTNNHSLFIIDSFTQDIKHSERLPFTLSTPFETFV